MEDNKMKRIIKYFAILTLISLMVLVHTNIVYAENSNAEDDFILYDSEITQENVMDDNSMTQFIDIESVIRDKAYDIDNIAKEKLHFQIDGDDRQTDDTSVTIYYGTMTGYLSQANDYVLYPANLTVGQYLQVRLALPNNSQIDYDLLLFDSSISLIKSSDYVTCSVGNGTLDESIGYIADNDETVYVCVYSVAGGSTTEAYTLDYSISSNIDEISEPDENAKEATALTLETIGAKVPGKINSPLDNDWYSFVVIDSPTYDKVRLNITSSSNTTGCKIEIYKNLLSNYYGMLLLGSGTGGEIELDAGTYYIRIVSTNSFSDFNVDDMPIYELSVVPVSRVDEVTITKFEAPGGVDNIDYPEGKLFRIEANQNPNGLFVVYGRVYYVDENGIKHPAANVSLNGEVLDKQWEALNRPDLSSVYSNAVTDANGYYSMRFYLNPPVGGLSYSVSISTHHYDLMNVRIKADDNSSASIKYFYYLKYCS
jgi:hypothetical protein